MPLWLQILFALLGVVGTGTLIAALLQYRHNAQLRYMEFVLDLTKLYYAPLLSSASVAMNSLESRLLASGPPPSQQTYVELFYVIGRLLTNYIHFVTKFGLYFLHDDAGAKKARETIEEAINVLPLKFGQRLALSVDGDIGSFQQFAEAVQQPQSPIADSFRTFSDWLNKDATNQWTGVKRLVAALREFVKTMSDQIEKTTGPLYRRKT